MSFFCWMCYRLYKRLNLLQWTSLVSVCNTHEAFVILIFFYSIPVVFIRKEAHTSANKIEQASKFKQAFKWLKNRKQTKTKKKTTITATKPFIVFLEGVQHPKWQIASLSRCYLSISFKYSQEASVTLSTCSISRNERWWGVPEISDRERSSI